MSIRCLLGYHRLRMADDFFIGVTYFICSRCELHRSARENINEPDFRP